MQKSKGRTGLAVPWSLGSQSALSTYHRASSLNITSQPKIDAVTPAIVSHLQAKRRKNADVAKRVFPGRVNSLKEAF